MQYGIKTHQGQCRQNRVVRKVEHAVPYALCFLLRFTLNCLISSITFPLSYHKLDSDLRFTMVFVIHNSPKFTMELINPTAVE